METMEAATGLEFKTVRKAQIGEWRQSYSSFAQNCIRKLTRALISRLGYAGGIAHNTNPQNDYREQVNRFVHPALRQTVTSWLLATEDGRPPNSLEITAEVQKLAAAGIDLLKLASIAEAIYYVQKIFVDTASPQARIALNVFVNLNLSFFRQWPVQVAAWYSLRRLESESGLPMLARLGCYHGYRIRVFNGLWKLM
jgi:hypothetical protein